MFHSAAWIVDRGRRRFGALLFLLPALWLGSFCALCQAHDVPAVAAHSSPCHDEAPAHDCQCPPAGCPVLEPGSAALGLDLPPLGTVSALAPVAAVVFPVYRFAAIPHGWVRESRGVPPELEFRVLLI